MILLSLLIIGTAQASLGDQLSYLPNPQIDVLRYRVSLEAPRLDSPQIEVRAEIELVALEASDRLELHAESSRIHVRQVLGIDGTPLPFRFARPGPEHIRGRELSGDYLEITPDRPLAAGEPTRVLIDYTLAIEDAPPSREAVGLAHARDFMGMPALYTRAWPYYARFWLPSNDHPSDPASFELVADVPSTSLVAANGALVEGTWTEGSGIMPASGLRRFRWRLDEPSPAYGLSFVIGAFRVDAHDAALGTGTIPSTLYTPAGMAPSRLSEYLRARGRTEDAMRFFSETLGDYTFPKLGIAVTPHPFSMEHPSLVTLVDPGAAVHETVHHWWGDGVLIARWSDVWISEGFTTYLTGVFSENAQGNPACMIPGNVRLDDSVDADPFDVYGRTYCGGAKALHELRAVLASQGGISPSDWRLSRLVFLALTRDLYQELKGRPTTTEEILGRIEARSAAVLRDRGLTVDQVRLSQALASWRSRWF